MSKQNSISREVYWHGIFWNGRAEDLIAAGLCTPDLLPGAPGRNKYSITVKGPRGRKMRIIRKGQTFRVYRSNEELLSTADGAFRTFMARTLQPVPLEG